MGLHDKLLIFRSERDGFNKRDIPFLKFILFSDLLKPEVVTLDQNGTAIFESASEGVSV